MSSGGRLLGALCRVGQFVHQSPTQPKPDLRYIADAFALIERLDSVLAYRLAGATAR
jgi:hypothetical protein